LTDELRRAIGYETAPVVFEIDKTLINRFVDAVEDANPLWQDEEKARKGPYGGIVAPPSLLCAVLATGTPAWESIASALPPRALDGGGEWEFSQPVRLGDTISVVNRLIDITERQGRLGPMLLVTSELTWRNQRGELVAKAHSTVIRY
jgi:acyl dehydratase